jgi:hypothetical protein
MAPPGSYELRLQAREVADPSHSPGWASWLGRRGWLGREEADAELLFCVNLSLHRMEQLVPS